MYVLVAGGNGQVGSEFNALATDNIHVAALGSAELDVTSPDSINAAIERYSPNVIINAAAYTAVDKAETEAEIAYKINRDGVANLAAACKKQDIPLIHISTDYVFDGKSKEPYSEEDISNPQGVYGASKLAGELALKECWEKHIIVRVSWVFGQYGNNFVKTMLRLAEDRDELSVVADQWGAPTAARSIAENLLKCAERCNSGESEKGEKSVTWGVYHLPSSPFTNWHGFAESIFAKAAKAGYLTKAPRVKPIASSEYPTPASRPENSRLISIADKDKLFTPCQWETELDTVLKSIFSE